MKPGQVLNAAEIGLLATVGKIQDIKVYRRARVGLLSTGDELVAASTVDLPQGKIRDSNKRMLQALLKDLGAEAVDLGTVKDSGEAIDTTMRHAIEEIKCDLIVTSGGVSMGELDLIKPYIEL